MFYIYILYSPSSDKYYVGYTNNYQRRLIEHNTSEKTTYTSKHRPWSLKLYLNAIQQNRKQSKSKDLLKNKKAVDSLKHFVTRILIQKVP